MLDHTRSSWVQSGLSDRINPRAQHIQHATEQLDDGRGRVHRALLDQINQRLSTVGDALDGGEVQVAGVAFDRVKQAKAPGEQLGRRRTIRTFEPDKHRLDLI